MKPSGPHASRTPSRIAANRSDTFAQQIPSVGTHAGPGAYLGASHYGITRSRPAMLMRPDPRLRTANAQKLISLASMDTYPRSLVSAQQGKAASAVPHSVCSVQSP